MKCNPVNPHGKIRRSGGGCVSSESSSSSTEEQHNGIRARAHPYVVVAVARLREGDSVDTRFSLSVSPFARCRRYRSVLGWKSNGGGGSGSSRHNSQQQQQWQFYSVALNCCVVFTFQFISSQSSSSLIGGGWFTRSFSFCSLCITQRTGQ